MTNLLRGLVSGKKVRYKEGEFDLDLTYVTPRIIAMSFPASNTIQRLYRNSSDNVAAMLESKHGGKYWVYNLSEQDYGGEEGTLFGGRYTHVTNWRDHHATTLINLASTCRKIY